jgi:SAM-dependent methyltransferase
MKPSFDDLIRDGLTLPISGWDFSAIKDRSTSGSPSWNYRALARRHMQGIRSMLDQDTGGGEVLSTLGPFPPQTWAGENYPPNIPIAKNRLEPLGIQVLSNYPDASIPLPSGCLDLVLNRHGGYAESELYRLLKPGGIFLTQQVGGRNCIRINELLQEKVNFMYSYWTRDLITSKLAGGGFEILTVMEEFPPLEFFDIGALVFYLRLVSWQIDDFTVEKYHSRLMAIHQEIQSNGPLKVNEHRILVEARKPD